MLCNALMQPHFDYACSAWYPNLNRKLTKKIQIAQNKCIRFCLNMGNRTHIGIEEFKKINWLPTRERFEQCVCVGAYKFFNNLSPSYMSDIFNPINSIRTTRSSIFGLHQPARSKNLGQKALSYLGPKFWNPLLSQIKTSRSANSFKHAIKKDFFSQLQDAEDDCFLYYTKQRGRFSAMI